MTTRSGTTTTVTFGYGGFGRRVRKTVRSGTTTGFLYLGADLYMQLNSSGAWTTEYSELPGIDQPQAITRSAGATYHVARDTRSGSVAGLVRPSDDSTVAKYTYTPFGSLIAGQSMGTVPNGPNRSKLFDAAALAAFEKACPGLQKPVNNLSRLRIRASVPPPSTTSPA
ncbi:MAG: hypothetical protein ACRENQ_14235 [Gemmatimonadaceae bacterium]